MIEDIVMVFVGLCSLILVGVLTIAVRLTYAFLTVRKK